MCVRLHISLDDELVAELDRRAGAGRRSAFIVAAIRQALDDEHRWDELEAALGTIPDHGHEWDDDPAQWVTAERKADTRRVG